MIDETKIDEAAYKFATSQTHGELLSLIDGYKEGYKDAVNEFLKDLWHPIEEEPKLVGEEIIIEMFLKSKRHTIVLEYMVGKEELIALESVRWITNWNSFIQPRENVIKYRWCYLKDLLPKEGGEQ